jgi:hypothetical protein
MKGKSILNLSISRIRAALVGLALGGKALKGRADFGIHGKQ